MLVQRMDTLWVADQDYGGVDMWADQQVGDLAFYWAFWSVQKLEMKLETQQEIYQAGMLEYELVDMMAGGLVVKKVVPKAVYLDIEGVAEMEQYWEQMMVFLTVIHTD